MKLYHHTTREAAEGIFNDRRMLSKEQGRVFFSSRLRGGQADGYGSSAVEVHVPTQHAQLDDEFPSGERHYSVAAASLRPEQFKRVIHK